MRPPHHDDGDGLVDHAADPGCETASSNNESPSCDDVDNGADGWIDYPEDPSCSGLDESSESGPGSPVVPIGGLPIALLALGLLADVRRRLRRY